MPVLALLSLLSAPDTFVAREKLAVLDLEPRGVDKTLAGNVSALVTATVRKAKRFDVLSSADLEKLLQFEESKQLAGQSADSAAIAAMGEGLGFAKMLHGSLGKIGTVYVLSLSIVDTKSARVLASETMTAKEDALLTAAQQAVAGLWKQLDKHE